MSLMTVLLAVGLVLAAAVVVGLVLLIKYFIRYNARQPRGKSRRQAELEHMDLEDL